MGRSISNAGGLIENRTSSFYDSSSKIESRLVSFGNAFVILENGRSLLIDSAPTLEGSRGASFGSDSFPLIESRTNSSINCFASIENQAVLVYDASDSLENLLVLPRPDAIASLESRSTIFRNTIASVENRGLLIAIFDGLVTIENATSIQASDAITGIENRAIFVRDSISGLESLSVLAATSVTADAFPSIENMRIWGRDAFASLENQHIYRTDEISAIENQGTARISRDSLATIENLAFVSKSGLFISLEASAFANFLSHSSIEELVTVRGDIYSLFESAGSVHVVADSQATLESTSSRSFDSANLSLESNSVLRADSVALINSLQLLIQHSAPSVEILSTIIADFPGTIESLSVRSVTADSLGSLEISGSNIQPFDIMLATIEFGGGAGYDSYASQENVAVVAWPFDPDEGPITLDGPYIVLNKTNTNISSARIRLISVHLTAPDEQARPFAPLPAATFDTFGFDFTADASTATIISAIWTCTFDPGNTSASDDVPQARVITFWNPTTINITNLLDSTIQPIKGVFAIAMIGACPLPAVGGVYHLTVTVALSDTRVLSAHSQFLCSLPIE